MGLDSSVRATVIISVSLSVLIMVPLSTLYVPSPFSIIIVVFCVSFRSLRRADMHRSRYVNLRDDIGMC